VGKLARRPVEEPDDENSEEGHESQLPANPAGQLISGVVRSVNALESIAKSLIERQDKSDAKIDALTKELAKARRDAKNNAVMNSQAASEAEALNSLGYDLKGPQRFRGEADNYLRGELMEDGLPPESDPRF